MVLTVMKERKKYINNSNKNIYQRDRMARTQIPRFSTAILIHKLSLAYNNSFSFRMP